MWPEFEDWLIQMLRRLDGEEGCYMRLELVLVANRTNGQMAEMVLVDVVVLTVMRMGYLDDVVYHVRVE